MADAAIENPILNQPFAEPRRHFRFGDNGITNDVVAGRRPSSYFVPGRNPRPRLSPNGAPSRPFPLPPVAVDCARWAS
jgi:hypothetical protein